MTKKSGEQVSTREVDLLDYCVANITIIGKTVRSLRPDYKQ